MSHAPVAPDVGHNLPPVAEIGKEMTHQAHLWATKVSKGDKHRAAIMVQVFTLRGYMEDPQLRLLVKGMLADADVPSTKRSSEFTQLLRFAFQHAKAQPEPSQLSRWAWALQHAWSQVPRPQAEDVIAFIAEQGGDVACREIARKAAKAEAADADKLRTAPIPYPLACVVPDAFVGQWVKVEKDESGQARLTPRKVLSLDITSAPSPLAISVPAPEAA